MNRKDWTLMAAALAKGDPLEPVELQKSLFLLGEKKPEAVGDDFYEFEPYDYGPFCQRIYQDAERLEHEGHISIATSPSGEWREYSITERGMERAKQLQEVGDVDPDAVEYLLKAVGWARSLSFNELVKSIYAHFPEYRANSVFESR